MLHFMILSILYINLLNISWIKKISTFEEYGYILKAPYASKINIMQESFDKLIYGIDTIIKCGTWQPKKLQLVSRSRMKCFIIVSLN